MASFHTKTFTKNDDWMTPKQAWVDIKQYLPKEGFIWEPFYGDGKSGYDLHDITGLEVFQHPDHNFHDGIPLTQPFSHIVTNPPFSDCKRIMPKLVEYGIPFIMIMPASKINTQYFRQCFAEQKDHIQIIIPRRRIQFLKMVDGTVLEKQENKCNFDCFYYCWKMDLPRDIIWLNDEPDVPEEKVAETVTVIELPPSTPDPLTRECRYCGDIGYREDIMDDVDDEEYGCCYDCEQTKELKALKCRHCGISADDLGGKNALGEPGSKDYGCCYDCEQAQPPTATAERALVGLQEVVAKRVCDCDLEWLAEKGRGCCCPARDISFQHHIFHPPG